ncbi:MAG: hypothetical protein HY738_13075 [Bacteroidia bacterium]|nr:hypothetical protein [Bacteroidia bacterium]
MKTKLLFFIVIAFIWSCKKDNSNDNNQTEPEPITCIDVHSQPPYPEQGANVDLQSILTNMNSNNVARSVLSARVLMQYSDDIAEFANANPNPNKITAAVALKLTEMETSDTGFINNLSQQVSNGKYKAISEMLLYHAFDRVFPIQWNVYTTDMDYVQEKLAILQPSAAKAIAYDNAMNFWNF